MLKATRAKFSFPLAGKININGFRAETSLSPQSELRQGKLYLEDSWKLQLITTSPEVKATPEASPLLLEFPVRWQADLPWSQDYPAKIILSYKKKPHIVNSSITKDKSGLMLNLELETVIDIDIEAGSAPSQDQAPVSPSVPADSAENVMPPSDAGITDSPVCSAETISPPTDKPPLPAPTPTHLPSFDLQSLEKRVALLEKILLRQEVIASRLKGCILDAFRLVPVPKADIELYLPGFEDRIAHTISDFRGVYSFSRIIPGVYDIRVSHQRYPTLEIKNYTVKEAEEKAQDFLLSQALKGDAHGNK